MSKEGREEGWCQRKKGRLVSQDGRHCRMVGVEGREGVTDMYRSKVGVE